MYINVVLRLHLAIDPIKSVELLIKGFQVKLCKINFYMWFLNINIFYFHFNKILNLIFENALSIYYLI